MFCSNCGNKINDGAKFCSNCGTKTASHIDQHQNNPAGDTGTLPAGMTRMSDGKIRWSFIEKKDEYICYLDNEKITVLHEIKRKKRSALGEFLLNTAELAAMESESYDPFLPLPSELEGDETAPTVKVGDKEYNRYELCFRYMSAMKEDRKKGVLKVYSLSCWWTICILPEQYDFVLDYILLRHPDIKRK